jgi:hypothetical protein
MNNLSIGEILALPDNSAIDAVQGRVTEVYDQRQVKGGKTVQDAKLVDGGGKEIKLAIWDHPDCSIYKGREVILKSGPKGGLKVVYDTYKQRNTNYISVSRGCTFQYLEVHSAAAGKPAPESANYNQVVGPLPAPSVHNGAKVGMAVNNAVNFMTSAGEQFDAEKLHWIASEILKVSVKLEAGELKDSPSENKPF